VLPPKLDAAARRILTDVLDSFEKLVLVVHLYRQREQPCTLEELAQAIALTRDLVAETLAGLAADGVVRSADGRWALDPRGKWAANVDALMQVYEEDRIVVHDAMTQLALERIRGQAANVFADAFLFRQPKKGKPDA
jgi:hypothetical protein